MKITVQRVKKASCLVNQKIISSINEGFLLLIGFTHNDNMETIKKMAKKIAHLRIFDDQLGKMNLSIKDIDGAILAISQFTLYGDSTHGNRPSFIESMNKESAEILYNQFVDILINDYQINTLKGSYGNHMYLDILCDGPVTINLEE